jgi:hypothetical protein
VLNSIKTCLKLDSKSGSWISLLSWESDVWFFLWIKGKIAKSFGNCWSSSIFGNETPAYEKNSSKTWKSSLDTNIEFSKDETKFNNCSSLKIIN